VSAVHVCPVQRYSEVFGFEEEQTVDHAVIHCPIHQPPYGAHCLTVLDDETIEWLLNTSLEIYCCLAVD